MHNYESCVTFSMYLWWGLNKDTRPRTLALTIITSVPIIIITITIIANVANTYKQILIKSSFAFWQISTSLLICQEANLRSRQDVLYDMVDRFAFLDFNNFIR